MSFTLTMNDREGVSGFAQGGIYRESLIYTASADIPANAILRIAPALFDQVHISNQIQDNELFWYLSWNAAPATYTCSRNFDAKYANVIVKVKVFTARIFEIQFEWMGLADTHKYLFPYLFQPLKLWENQSVNKGFNNVYNSAGQSLGVRLSIKDDPAISTDYLVDYVAQEDNPAQGVQWKQLSDPTIPNNYFLEVGGEPANGYVVGSTLTVKLRGFPRYTNSQYFAGIYRVDQLLNQNAQFYDELDMQYALANISAAEPFALTTNIIDRDMLLDMNGFRYDNLQCVADFSIDGDYFVSGAQYKVFVIVKESCQWRSYVSDLIPERSKWDQPSGDMEITAVTVDGISIDINQGNCLYNIPYGAELEITAEFDTLTYEADLAIRSLPGTFEDYYTEAECFVSDNSRKVGDKVEGEVITDELIGTKQTTTYAFKIPENWQGLTKYVNIGWIFQYTGQTDHLISFVTINMANNPDAITLGTPTNLPEEICDIDAVNTEFCFVSDDAETTHKFFVDTYLEGNLIEDDSLILTKTDTDFSTNDDACLNFKYENIGNEEQYCLNLRAWNPDVDPAVFPCDDFVLTLERIANGYEIEYSLLFDIPAWADSDILDIDVRVDTPIYGQNYLIIQAHGKKSEYITFSEGVYSDFPWLIVVDIRRTDGSSGSFQFYWTPSAGGDEITVDTCSDPPTQFCEENPILTATVTWNYIAPPTYGSLLNKTITAVETNFGSPTTTTKYKIINGTETAYTGAFTTGAFNSVALRYVLQYADCGEIELYHCITEQEPSIP